MTPPASQISAIATSTRNTLSVIEASMIVPVVMGVLFLALMGHL